MTHMAQLGCPSGYMAVVYRRGGDHPTYNLRGLTQVNWSRKLDAISTAQVTIAKMSAGADCCAGIGQTQPWSHELGIFRDNDLMWQGPVQTITEDKDYVTITAADVVAWMGVRYNRDAYDFINSGMDQTDIALYFINQAFAPDDPHVREFVVSRPTGATYQAPQHNAYTTTWGAALDDLAKQDLDYTTVGRRIIVGGDLSPLSPHLALSDTAFLANLQVIMDGGQLATRFCASGQEGANVACVGGVDKFYGLVERMVSADSITSEWDALYNAQSEYNVSYPQPVVITVPSGASLADTAPIGIDQLVCGARIDVALESFCRDIGQPMRLTSVNVAWDGQFETVGVNLDPFVGSSRTAVLGQ